MNILLRLVTVYCFSCGNSIKNIEKKREKIEKSMLKANLFQMIIKTGADNFENLFTVY